DLENVWIVGNQAYSGGGLSVLLGTVTLNSVTISGNECESVGGGIELLGIGQTIPSQIGRLEIRNSTISGNHAQYVGGAIYVAAAGQLLVENSTIAENTNRPGDPTMPRLNPDLVYTLVEGACSAGPDASCIYLSSNDEELAVSGLGLGPLAMNGGTTPTHALTSASPAIDLVPLGAACPPDDQRGVARPQDGDGDREARCDAGSFELIRGPAGVEIPTLGEIALITLMLLLACAGVGALRR
ncbi:MAG: IPTL-CTERM sorting domain-containing protein, partial [bacterium]|nr:IPTL-CTERM sorting domain-containing protein [bacterium]